MSSALAKAQAYLKGERPFQKGAGKASGSASKPEEKPSYAARGLLDSSKDESDDELNQYLQSLAKRKGASASGSTGSPAPKPSSPYIKASTSNSNKDALATSSYLKRPGAGKGLTDASERDTRRSLSAEFSSDDDIKDSIRRDSKNLHRSYPELAEGRKSLSGSAIGSRPGTASGKSSKENVWIKSKPVPESDTIKKNMSALQKFGDLESESSDDGPKKMPSNHSIKSGKGKGSTELALSKAQKVFAAASIPSSSSGSIAANPRQSTSNLAAKAPKKKEVSSDDTDSSIGSDFEKYISRKSSARSNAVAKPSAIPTPTVPASTVPSAANEPEQSTAASSIAQSSTPQSVKTLQNASPDRTLVSSFAAEPSPQKPITSTLQPSYQKPTTTSATSQIETTSNLAPSATDFLSSALRWPDASDLLSKHSDRPSVIVSEQIEGEQSLPDEITEEISGDFGKLPSTQTGEKWKAKESTESLNGKSLSGFSETASPSIRSPTRMDRVRLDVPGDRESNGTDQQYSRNTMYETPSPTRNPPPNPNFQTPDNRQNQPPPPPPPFHPSQQFPPNLPQQPFQTPNPQQYPYYQMPMPMSMPMAMPFSTPHYFPYSPMPPYAMPYPYPMPFQAWSDDFGRAASPPRSAASTSICKENHACGCRPVQSHHRHGSSRHRSSSKKSHRKESTKSKGKQDKKSKSRRKEKGREDGHEAKENGDDEMEKEKVEENIGVGAADVESPSISEDSYSGSGSANVDENLPKISGGGLFGPSLPFDSGAFAIPAVNLALMLRMNPSIHILDSMINNHLDVIRQYVKLNARLIREK
ncbi:hypothetical protein HDU97_008225 [Phlyctochytrium planicorne]|nr:hypothetical protein HDU97_008225 [Phlyctochytrium planicorne]